MPVKSASEAIKEPRAYILLPVSLRWELISVDPATGSNDRRGAAPNSRASCRGALFNRVIVRMGRNRSGFVEARESIRVRLFLPSANAFGVRRVLRSRQAWSCSSIHQRQRLSGLACGRGCGSVVTSVGRPDRPGYCLRCILGQLSQFNSCVCRCRHGSRERL
jgi:hypothetical protein